MVKIQIEIDSQLDSMLIHDMIDHREECKNKEGNVDKRIAVVRILKEYFDKLCKFYYDHKDDKNVK